MNVVYSPSRDVNSYAYTLLCDGMTPGGHLPDIFARRTLDILDLISNSRSFRTSRTVSVVTRLFIVFVLLAGGFGRMVSSDDRQSAYFSSGRQGNRLGPVAVGQTESSKERRGLTATRAVRQGEMLLVGNPLASASLGEL